MARSEGDPEDLMTAADVAHILELSADMVRLLTRQGKLSAAVTTVRGMRLYRRADVERLAEERRKGRETARESKVDDKR